MKRARDIREQLVAQMERVEIEVRVAGVWGLLGVVGGFEGGRA